ncbi:hypothetical protein SDRG_09413 [Saprolegnia diclina VS20]|uniref:Uncharacterized protein n=1 Tax=Saprolegnia diclina (strain VS20) TaxID=1156394 RepID=T0RRV3_SAPDV|nr:hypothetical protein SDRG_09413 [Saprolegnia diclina VS20]EQC32882.1 hypothetical protein SDRG_09413 [Saprolegnia diclina VS20]|eukprot:XP_008613568.1 hypothetical protein SDRG_09413 [Saprolegnia diclina VS20]
MLPPPSPSSETVSKKRPRETNEGAWSADEHERFLMALQLYPEGPWKAIAEIVQTRNAKQTQTHMQKCKEKLVRQHRRDHADDEPLTCARSKHSANLKVPAIEPIPFTAPSASLDDVVTDLPLEDALDFFCNLPNA